jgi:hypothetical protein
MARFKVTWTGKIDRTIPVENPADACYYVFSRYREEMLPGILEVEVQEGHGVRLAQISFLARLAREIEAEDATEAVRAFTYDDRLPGSFTAASVKVEPVGEADNG